MHIAHGPVLVTCLENISTKQQSFPSRVTICISCLYEWFTFVLHGQRPYSFTSSFQTDHVYLCPVQRPFCFTSFLPTDPVYLCPGHRPHFFTSFHSKDNVSLCPGKRPLPTQPSSGRPCSSHSPNMEPCHQGSTKWVPMAPRRWTN